MSIRVIVNGARGRMGTQACAAITAAADLELVASLGRSDDLALAIQQHNAEVVVDLTNADVGFENAQLILEHQARPVMGTSGFLPEHVEALTTMAARKNLGGVIAPNFSIAAVLMMRFAQTAARYYADVEILEMHHEAKLDAPSGTALKTAEMIATARASARREVAEKLLIDGVRGGQHEGVPIHAMRLPGVVARQQVIFGGLGETLTIDHNSIDRACFMPGILLSCRRVMASTQFHYGLESLLFEEG